MYEDKQIKIKRKKKYYEKSQDKCCLYQNRVANSLLPSEVKDSSLQVKQGDPDWMYPDDKKKDFLIMVTL